MSVCLSKSKLRSQASKTAVGISRPKWAEALALVLLEDVGSVELSAVSKDEIEAFSCNAAKIPSRPQVSAPRKVLVCHQPLHS